MEDSIERKLREFIIQHFLFGDASKPLSDEDSFLEKRIIDSTGVVQLVSFIEEAFGITVQDEEIIPDNLDTIRKLVHFIQKKTGAVVESSK